jgi:hypothetical protein
MTEWHWLSHHWSSYSLWPVAGACPHCGRRLQVCPACQGEFDSGRLCQHCMSGIICPTCQRHWTWN